jgi:hypothetical protein
VDRIGQGALESLRSKLLNLLWYDAIAGGVGLTTLGSGVVDSIGDCLLNSLGELLLGLVWD